MSMIVQHNLTAMNSNRMLGITTEAQAKSTEKLSSGYKINRAADDAAGLSISEKMRKQIRGLTQASLNAEDGISAVQTAEGALTEVHDMLQRMNELAVKSANGTNSESDRQAIQAEIDQLVTEIDRVSETTKFNETYLLKGDKDQTKLHTFSYKNFAADQTAKATMTTADGLSLSFAAANATTQSQQDDQNELLMALRDQGATIGYTSTWDATANAGAGEDVTSYSLSLSGAVADKFTVTAGGTNNDTYTVKNAAGETLATLTVAGGTVATSTTESNLLGNSVATSITAAESTAAKAKYYDRDGNAISANALDSYFSASTTTGASPTTTVSVRADASQLYDAVGNKVDANAANIAGSPDLVGNLSIALHVGADATANNQITMNIAAMSAKGLGVNGLKVDGVDDSNALDAIETIKAAIEKVSAQRSDLGAIQNRLEHTIKNLDNVVENTTAAESQIRDTDMAAEMVTYSKNQILQQAGQSMLAQANQANQGVLSLLQ